MKIALQATVEGSLDLVLKEAKPKRDENGNRKIGRKDHAKLLTIPGTRGDRRLVVTKENAEALGVGSVPEFWKWIQASPAPGRGDLHYAAVLDDFKFVPAEVMMYEDILTEIEQRTGRRPAKHDLPKTYAILALRRLRRLAEQDEPPVVVPDEVKA